MNILSLHWFSFFPPKNVYLINSMRSDFSYVEKIVSNSLIGDWNQKHGLNYMKNKYYNMSEQKTHLYFIPRQFFGWWLVILSCTSKDMLFSPKKQAKLTKNLSISLKSEYSSTKKVEHASRKLCNNYKKLNDFLNFHGKIVAMWIKLPLFYYTLCSKKLATLFRFITKSLTPKI